MAKPRVYIVMGVSGSGKSTIAQLLADELDIPFIEGDEYHPPENVRKMQSGTPLEDQDRYSWLVALNAELKKHRAHGAVLSCSALKKSYRQILTDNLGCQVSWIYLKGEYDLIKDRMNNRKGHFMPAGLLESQFNTLEPPEKAIEVDIGLRPKEILSLILIALKKEK